MQTTRYNRLKLSHEISTMFGGIFLAAGSSMYFSSIIKQYSIAATAGGWFLSIGSLFLLLADLQEFILYRPSNCSSKICTMSIHDEFEESNSLVVLQLEQTNEHWKCLFSAFGSAFYVIGSVLLIPHFHRYITIGNWLIIIGSLVIMLSSIWKIFPKLRSDLLLNLSNGFGGLFYFLGILYILCVSPINDHRMNISATLCVIGGSCFFLSSFFLHYRYFHAK